MFRKKVQIEVDAKKQEAGKQEAGKQEAEETRGPEPPLTLPASDHYTDARAHLLDELRCLNLLLAAQVLRLRRADFYESIKDFRGLFIADGEIDALLTAGVFEDESQTADEPRVKRIENLLNQAQNIRQEIGRRLQNSAAQQIRLPLVQISRYFQLSEFEQQALVICLAPQVDARYEKLFAYLQNDITRRSPSIDLILSLLCQSMEERLNHLHDLYATAGLRRHGVIESIENSPGVSIAQQSLRADPRIVQYLLGNKVVDQRLLSDLRFFPSLDWAEVVVPEALRDRLQRLCRAAVQNMANRRSIFYLHGRPGVGKKTLARALCGELGVNLAVVDLRLLARAPEGFAEKIRLILREGLLQPCAVYLDHLEQLGSADGDNVTLMAGLMQEIGMWGWLTFLGGEKPLPAALIGRLPIYAIEIPTPDYAAQKELWGRHLDGLLAEDEWANIDQLAVRFDLTGGQIIQAVDRAAQAAFMRDPETGRINLADLNLSSRVQAQPQLGSMARKIEPKFVWGDMVLPEDQLQQLRELSNQVKHRQRVMSEWGFANKLSLGRGLNALFAGPSGTGKTMAAEIVAHDLGLDLFKIDLSAVVSKYIGETEKNLNRVFSEAERSNAILFFDEADALLGKRSEVKDAHDRYANIEIAYLLQKMEEYEGITILATNLRQNIDEAFVRRIRFIVEFPFPSEEYRLRIWQGIWPKETPLAPEIDLNFMALQFKLTGGNIRNIALAAAFLASENGQVVRMKHLLQATKREFHKMGKVVKAEEFGQSGKVS